MNLQGIRDSPKTQEYFWAVCGVSALVIVILACAYAFRKQWLVVRSKVTKEDVESTQWMHERHDQYS